MDNFNKRTTKLFAVSALFDKPDDIIKAAKKVSGEGYKKFDVNTPYPVHGMDPAMGMKPSRLGYITLALGLGGMLFAFAFMSWAMSVDYPMVIGGKPFLSAPAYIPITFEVTVLLATVATVIGMITFFFNFPDQNHPTNDTNYMKSVSVDKFGIYIEADDPKFDREGVTELFNSLGATAVEEIYYPEKETYPLFQPKFILFLIAVFVVVSGGTYFSLNKLMFMIPFNWMMFQDKVVPQERSDFYADQFAMRQPVEGTVARGYMPYPYNGVTEPEEYLSNPLIPTKENLELGKKKFLTFCSPCHGNYAEGDSRLRGQFPNPPTLHTERARGMEDGRLYHIIVNGQNIMPSYASQTTEKERWAIVNYIRVLQRAKNATESDLQKIKESADNVE